MADDREASPEPLLPSWDAVRRDYIEPGLLGRIVVRPSPKVELFVDAGAARFGALLELPAGAAVPPTMLTDVLLSEVRHGPDRCLQIATATPALFGTFYLLLVDVVEAVLIEGTDPVTALTSSLADWNALLQTSALLNEERQLGLLGELWLLDRLVQHRGPAALESWVGPTGQTHDFRLEEDEFEVKTTSGQRRVHIINGADQLAPSLGCRLYLLSVRYVDAGSGGETLPEAVARVRSRLESEPGAVDRFVGKLDRLGYRAVDADHYSRRRRIADGPRLIPVVDGVPRLTPEALNSLPRRFAAAGIGDLSYRVDVEGMGMEDGHPDFLALLPT